MKILWVEAEGFKGFNKKVRFEFNGNNTLIQADNGKGKTSIAELISFAIHGVTLSGLSTSIDDLININYKGSITASVGFRDPVNLTARSITRIKNKKGTEILLDGKPVTKEALTAEFDDYKIFLSIFYNTYFMGLDDTAKRKIIESVTPSIDYEKIFAEKTSSLDLLEKYDVKIYDPKAHKKVKDEIKLLEKEIDAKTTEIKVLEQQNLSISDQEIIKMYDEQEQQLANKLKTAQEVVQQQKLLTKMVQDSNLVNEQIKSVEQQIHDVSTQIDSLEIPENEQDIYNKAQIYNEKHEQEIHSLLGQKISQSSFPKFLSNTVGGEQCPTCYQSISQEHINGTNAAIQTQIDNYKKHNESIDEKIAEHQLSISNCNTKRDQKIQEIRFQKEKIQTLKNNKLQLETTLAGLQSRLYVPKEGDQKIFDFDKFDIIQNEYLKVHEHNNKAREHNAVVLRDQEQKQTNFKRIDNITNELTRLSEKLQELSIIEEGINPSYLHKKAIEEKMDSIKSHLKNVDIELYKQQKTTGEWKETFDIYFHHKPWRRLSFSEQIRCGIEISHMLNCVSDKNYPIFIDNTESVRSIEIDPENKSQIFMAKFVEGMDLTVSDHFVQTADNHEVEKQPQEVFSLA